VRLAVERKVALGARTRLEIDIMNTKYADGYRIVSEDEQAVAFIEDWVGFCEDLERRYGVQPRKHDWERIRAFHFLDQDENGSRYELLDGVHLVWKRCHSWGNVIDTAGAAGTFDPSGKQQPVPVAPTRNTYCPAPYDQFVIQWNGDVVACCTDYEGRTKTANVFASSIEEIWKGATLTQRKKDMLEGRLLDVCSKCMGIT
jgi:radical SAM protein with 4Fe4S-binding SPASM domain